MLSGPDHRCDPWPAGQLVFDTSPAGLSRHDLLLHLSRALSASTRSASGICRASHSDALPQRVFPGGLLVPDDMISIDHVSPDRGAGKKATAKAPDRKSLTTSGYNPATNFLLSGIPPS